MKLLYCPECDDIRKLTVAWKAVCLCECSAAQYRPDGLHADVWGDGVLIGLDNHTLSRSLDLHDEHPEENLTIAAWLISKPNRHVGYHP